MEKNLDVNELRGYMTKTLRTLSEIQKIKVNHKFIQKKVNQIHKQGVEFRDFAYKSITLARSICIHAENWTEFNECLDDDDVSNDDLLELSRSLLDDFRRDKENAVSLWNQIKAIKDVLNKIVEEITKHDYEMLRKRESLDGKIETAEKVKNGARCFAIGGLMAVGATVAAVATGGVSLAAIGVVEAVANFGILSYFGGSAVANVSSVTSVYLDYERSEVREQLSQLLQGIQGAVETIIIANIASFDSFLDGQIIEIEEIIIKKLERHDGKRLAKRIVKKITQKAEETRKNFENYIKVMRQGLRSNEER